MKIKIEVDRKHAKQVRRVAQGHADRWARLDGVIAGNIERLEQARRAYAGRDSADDYAMAPDEWALLREAMEWTGGELRPMSTTPYYAVAAFLGANVCLCDGHAEHPKLSPEGVIAHAVHRYHEVGNGFLVMTVKEWARLRDVCISRGWYFGIAEQPQPQYVVGKFMGAPVVVR